MKSKNRDVFGTVRELFRDPQKVVSMFKNRTKENMDQPVFSPEPDNDQESLPAGLIIILLIIVIILLIAIIFVIVRLCRGQYKSAMLVCAVLFISPIPLIGSNGIGALGCLVLLFLRPNRPRGCIEK